MSTARGCWPPPHDLSHAPHGSNWKSQWTAQGRVLQLRWSDRPGHEAPPCAGRTRTVRSRNCTPPPHWSVQVLHSSKADTTQSTDAGVGCGVGKAVGSGVGRGVGHASWLQMRCVESGHSRPPCAASRFTVTRCVCSPPPHERVHAPHACSMYSQCTGHGCTLQLRSSRRPLHERPP